MAGLVGRVAAATLALGVAGVLAGCDPAATGAGPEVVVTASADTATSADPGDNPMTCEMLKNTPVGGKKMDFFGYQDVIPLVDGRWSGEHDNTIELQKPCAIGDLDGDGDADALGVVSENGGGSGTFFALVAWLDEGGGTPVCVAAAPLGDRTPVTSIKITNGRAQVVYLTRDDDAPMAVLNIKRTATYQLIENNELAEIGYVDAPYSE